MAHAHVSMQSCHDNSLDAKFLEENVEVSLEESAVSALRNHVVLFALIQFRYDLSAWCAGNCMVSPQFQFTVYTLDMGIITEDHRNSCSTRCIKKRSGCRYYSFSSVTGKRPCNKVIKHINYKNCWFFKFHNNIYLSIFVISTPARRKAPTP